LSVAIWWLRRDLRLTDNAALTAAHSRADQVVPLFILDPAILTSNWAGTERTAFLMGGLRALDSSLRERGSRLIVRAGNPVEILSQVMSESGARVIHAERDHSPYAQRRDATIAATLPLSLHEGVTVRAVTAIRKDDGTPYVVYSPYRQRWLANTRLARTDILPAPAQIATPADLKSLPIPDQPAPSPSSFFPPGEREAKRRLIAFIQEPEAPIYDYAKNRDCPALPGSSQLSPYLRFGMLSPRLAALAAFTASEQASTAAAREGAQIWLNELIWRDFYISILHHFPYIRKGSFRRQYDRIEWENNADHFAAWCEGRTGYPFVDAAMRQLRTMGWMHNRARMVVASFLVKDLFIDWRWGERWFMQQLIDGDPAANNGGWQWVAGTGADAAPYFRVFNPITQSQKFDPAGDYIRHWLPELSLVPKKYIHTPWQMNRNEQAQTGCRIGEEYPEPLVDHAWARTRILAAYKAARLGEEA
jgi:deoxyribodipyrimidine photo-lyase